MKVCRLCGELKELKEFYALNRNKDNKDTRCKSCISARQKVIYNETRDLVKIRARNIKRRYNLTVEEYDKMMLAGCAVCNTLKDLAMDHDHNCCPGKETCGKCIRGVLCKKHNFADGAFDTIEQIEKYLQYRKSCIK